MRRRHFSVLALVAGFGLFVGSTSSADDDPATASGYRLYRAAVATYYRASFEVYVRLNRAMPRERDEDGNPLNGGGILLEGVSGFTGARRAGVHSRHCYTTTVEASDPHDELPASLRHPRDGRRVHVGVRVLGVRRTLRGHAVLVRARESEPHPEKRLGC
jgi:hypothetical protein